jgi:hypothetical protein
MKGGGQDDGGHLLGERIRGQDIRRDANGEVAGHAGRDTSQGRSRYRRVTPEIEDAQCTSSTERDHYLAVGTAERRQSENPVSVVRRNRGPAPAAGTKLGAGEF